MPVAEVGKILGGPPGPGPATTEVAGSATSADGAHLAQPCAESIIQCLDNALDSSSLQSDTIDHINAHGTGTALGDVEVRRGVAPPQT